MEQLLPPPLRNQAQEFAMLIFLIARHRPTRGPPSQGSEHCRPLPRRSSRHEQTDPMHPWYKNGRAGGMIVALFDMGQSACFAGAHRAQSFGFHAFWLFQDGAIPQHQPVFPLGFPLLHLLVHVPQEKLINLLGFPLLMMNDRLKPFRSSSSPLQPVHVISQFREQEPMALVAEREDRDRKSTR